VLFRSKKNGVFVFDEITSKLNKPFAPKYTDYLAKFGRENQIWQRHSEDDHLKQLEKLGFRIEKIIETKIDKDLKNVLKNKDYKTNYGCHFTTVIKTRK
jgi:hypothetical protein